MTVQAGYRVLAAELVHSELSSLQPDSGGPEWKHVMRARAVIGLLLGLVHEYEAEMFDREWRTDRLAPR